MRVIAIVDQFFILHAPVLIAAAVTALHLLGYLAEKYLAAGLSPAVSVGVATAPAGIDLAILTDLADEALYRAKQTKNFAAVM